jgi:uncharacterized protein YdeI (YjbR/CyaY-like superfamily)
MGERRRIRPKSRQAWRTWLQKNHASSTGVWLVYAKKHSGLASLTYNDAVEEALCFGWIDSKINPIDDTFYMQVFTPRKPQGAWSALNRTRVKRLIAAGLMTAAGAAAIKTAKKLGTWEATTHADDLIIPPDLANALESNAEARRHWESYTASRRKGVLYRLAGAKRPETRAKYLREIIENMVRNLSSEERRVMAGFKRRQAAPRERRTSKQH